MTHASLAASPAPRSAIARTVLVADDDRTVRNLVSRVLTLKGYRPLTASGGEEALTLAVQQPVDAFVLDLFMPDIDGLEVCRALRGLDCGRNAPILCMTAAGEAPHVSSAFGAGADDFIVKPVNPHILDARLRGQIERYETMREMARLQANLDRYVSRRTRDMVREFTASGVLPAPTEAEVCVMFTDVRGFTQLSHEVDPRNLFASLSDNLGMQVDCVYRYGGYVDKFAGDGIMAVFDCDDAALMACRCAEEILGLTARGRNGHGESALEIGIGIHVGPALIGNVGSERHLDYSVIGKNVNLAARLCGSAAPMTAVVSSDVVKACGPLGKPRFRFPEPIRVRGVRDPIMVFRLLPPGAATPTVREASSPCSGKERSASGD